METVGKFMFLDEEEIMQYWEKVEATLTTHVVSKNPTTQRGQTIVANIIPKLHWYMDMAEGGFDWGVLKIPLLTPKLLDALEANITSVSKSYEEVSNSTLFLFSFSRSS